MTTRAGCASSRLARELCRGLNHRRFHVQVSGVWSSMFDPIYLRPSLRSWAYVPEDTDDIDTKAHVRLDVGISPFKKYVIHGHCARV